MKKIISIVLALTLALSFAVLFAGCSGKQETLTLNVYNWGEYISDGSEGSFYTVKEFENWYRETYGQKVSVNYETFASNEDMYAKLSTGAVSYDVIIPSEYIVERMIKEGMLAELNFDNIPNYANIDDNFKGLFYDPDNKFSVPYAYGVVGIIYDANRVDEADVGSWDLMWNEKYAGSVLQFNNSRDAFGTAIYKLNLDVNATDHAVWDKAYDELMKQKDLRYGLVMDEIFNLMESGEAAIGAYYAGDYFTMKEAQAENVDLRFYYPQPTNAYIDAMCIPANAQHKELAEIFINYMLSEEPAIANAEYTCYASPNKVVFNSEKYKQDMGEEAIAILYPGFENFKESYNRNAYHNLDADTLQYINTLWENVKNN